MFGFGKKKELFTLDKLFSGYLHSEKEIIKKRETVGFKFNKGIRQIEGHWSNISRMTIHDMESLDLKTFDLNLAIIETYLTLFNSNDYDEFAKLTRGLRSINYKFNPSVPTPSRTIKRLINQSYKGLILPDGNILGEVKIEAGNFYIYNIFDEEQIIII